MILNTVTYSFQSTYDSECGKVALTCTVIYGATKWWFCPIPGIYSTCSTSGEVADDDTKIENNFLRGSKRYTPITTHTFKQNQNENLIAKSSAVIIILIGGWNYNTYQHTYNDTHWLRWVAANEGDGNDLNYHKATGQCSKPSQGSQGIVNE